jgi:hypothetical protein
MAAASSLIKKIFEEQMMQIPAEGSVVEVVLDNAPTRYTMAPCSVHRAQPTLTLRGVVVLTPKWMKSSADLTILNSDTKGFNYIPMHKILSIGGIKVKQPKATADKILNMTSSKTGEVYTVRQDGRTKRWSCTCIGFQFHKKCRHVTKAQG